MYRRILVPLDGSKLAEAALPPAIFLARALGAQLTLLHLVESRAADTVHGDRHLTEAGEAEAYLGELAVRPELAGLPVVHHVDSEPSRGVVAGIVQHEGELAPDLIVMCSHGRGGLRKLLFGSIPQQVIAAGVTPVVLVKPRPGAEWSPYACRELLVPLDGDPAHEDGLLAAERLAAAISARLRLLSVVRGESDLSGRHAVTGRFLPGTSRALAQLDSEERLRYLRGVTERLRADRPGLDTSSEVRRGEPAETIVTEAAGGGADLIVLATHGKAGSEAFWAGSIAALVLEKTALPVLLVPVGKGEAPGG